MTYIPRDDASSVRVVKADWTEDTFPRCHADEPEPDTLVVTSIDDGWVMRTYPPGTWRYGHQDGPDGHPEVGFTSRLEAGRGAA